MNRMMIRARLLASVATVALLAFVMRTEAKGATAKPPSGSQDMGTLSAANDYNVLLDLTLKNGSPVVHTVDVGEIPASRSIPAPVGRENVLEQIPEFRRRRPERYSTRNRRLHQRPKSIQHILDQRAGPAWPI